MCTAMKVMEYFTAVDEVDLLPKSAPKVTDWQNLTDKTVSITVDHAREKACKQAQSEIDHIKAKAKEAMGTGDEMPNIDDINEKFFGTRSRLYRTFADEIPFVDGKHKLFMRCIRTFFISCAMHLTLNQLYEFNLFLGLLATKEEYTLFWNVIQQKDTPSSPTSVSFWRQDERALNTALQEAFVDGIDFEIHVTIDDDKVHFHVTKVMESHEPKAVQHVQDNRRGFVIDTAVFAATGVPVGFSAQGKNDSTATSTK